MRPSLGYRVLFQYEGIVSRTCSPFMTMPSDCQTETPITALRFGESDLRVVIYRGPDGVQVQTYDRLSPPLPEVIPDFERMTAPST